MDNVPGRTTLSSLLKKFKWRPIPNCPGRYVLAEGPTGMPPDGVIPGSDGTEHVGVARDPVVVTSFGDGGLISYRKVNGTFLHTLNTLEGFERKLRQLGIDRSSVRT